MPSSQGTRRAPTSGVPRNRGRKCNETPSTNSPAHPYNWRCPCACAIASHHAPSGTEKASDSVSTVASRKPPPTPMSSAAFKMGVTSENGFCLRISSERGGGVSPGVVVCISYSPLWYDFEDTQRAFAYISEGVRHERVESGLGDGQFYHHATARRDRDRLVSDHMVGRIAVSVGIAEDGSDNMEGGEQGWTGIHKKDADALSRFGYDG